MENLKEWLALRAEHKRTLYEQYGKPLEKANRGEYLAIGTDGRTILGKRAGEVLRKAMETFGSRNFALMRVGYSTFGKWLNLGV